MNKISKKILAIVTMAAFVVTMMPFAAFAAEPTKSYINTVDKDVVVTAGDKVKVEIETNDGTDLTKAYVWVEDEKENVIRDVQYYADNGTEQTAAQGKVAVLDQGYAMKPNALEDGKTFYVQINAKGTYTIHAGVLISDTETTTNTRADLVELNSDAGHGTIVVDPAEAAELTSLTVTQGETVQTVTNKKEVAIEDVLANNTASKTVTLTANGAKGVIADKDLQITTSSKNLVVTAEDDNYTTDRKGELELTYKATKAGTYYIYVKNADDNFAATLKVVIPEESDIVGINVTENNAQVIERGTNPDFTDAVQIELVDDQGDVVANNDTRLAAEPMINGSVGGQNVKDYVTIVDQPQGARLDYNNVRVIADDKTGAFTIGFTGVNASDLKEGEYTVQFALLDGDDAQVTFTLADFGTVQDMIIDVDDTVVSGKTVEGTVKYVDENGIEKPADGTVSVGYAGTAFDTSEGASNLSSPNFVVKALGEEKYLGSVITITAVDDYYGKIATADITVVDGVTVGTLAFDPTTGEADKDNTVKVSVVDEDGNVIDNVAGSIVAYVAASSDKEANVTVEPVGSVSEGKGKLTVYSDVETEADIVVAVRTGDGAIYAATLEYTFGEADVNADTIVAMTIGSSDIIVNNDIVSGDAAPFVDSNWRTMVPVRALSEAFGGTAEWDGDARTVTVVNGDTTIVFTADSDKYTVNGEEKTMDTELTIIDGRTYVPVKFVAEELGYKVTALKDAQGLTAGVVFQK